MSTFQDDQLRRAIAYHEAGHAVACITYRIRFKTVTIVPAENTLGRVAHPQHWTGNWRPDADSSNRARMKMERYVKMISAGDIAQSWVTKKLDNPECASDIEKAANWVSYFAGDSEEAGDYLGRLFDQAREDLSEPGPKAAVRAVAERLLEKETISSVEARAVCREAAASL